MIEAEDVQEFCGKNVGVVYTDSGKDFVLKGFLKKTTKNAIHIDNNKHGKAVIALDSIKKVFEQGLQ